MPFGDSLLRCSSASRAVNCVGEGGEVVSMGIKEERMKYVEGWEGEVEVDVYFPQP